MKKPRDLNEQSLCLKKYPITLFKFKFKFKLGKEDLHGGLCPIVKLSLKD